jgi:hypothetical protein
MMTDRLDIASQSARTKWTRREMIGRSCGGGSRAEAGCSTHSKRNHGSYSTQFLSTGFMPLISCTPARRPGAVQFLEAVEPVAAPEPLVLQTTAWEIPRKSP